jgi:DDE domain
VRACSGDPRAGRPPGGSKLSSGTPRAGRWRYVYRAIDQFGQVIDVLVSTRRDATAAHRFFQRAIGTTEEPAIRRLTVAFDELTLVI